MVPVFMGIIAGCALVIDDPIRIHPAPGHSIYHRPNAFGVQGGAIAMLRQFLFHPFVDIVNEFAATAIDLGDQHGISYLSAAFVQLCESMRRTQQDSILKSPALEGAEQLWSGRQSAGY